MSHFQVTFKNFTNWIGLDSASMAYAFKLFFAAISAFSVATLLNIDHAYWAAMPIWVVAQPQRGQMIERALFRVVGTLLGAGAGFCILMITDQPIIALGLLAIWVAINSGLTHILRGVHFYIPLMTGQTAAIVVLPSLLLPSHTLDIAISRVECTLIGVICVTLIVASFTPKSPRYDFYKRVRVLTGRSLQHFLYLVRRQESPELEQRLLLDIAQMESESIIVMAGSIEGYRQNENVNMLLASSLVLLSRSADLKERELEYELLTDDIIYYLSALSGALLMNDQFKSPLLEMKSIFQKIRDVDARLAGALEQIVKADSAIVEMPVRKMACITQTIANPRLLIAPLVNWYLARQAAYVSGGATLIASLLGYISGWPDAELAALAVCIFSMILGSMPNPHIVAPTLLKGVLVGVFFATIYRFFVISHVATPLMLIVSISPFLFLGAFARASKKYGAPAMDANMCFLLGSQAVLPAVYDTSTILSSAAALAVAPTLVTTGFILFPRKAHSQANDAMCIINNQLERLIKTTGNKEYSRWQPLVFRQILRVALHTEQSTITSKELLAAYSLGDAIEDIKLIARHSSIPNVKDGLLNALNLLGQFRDSPKDTAIGLLRLANSTQDRGAKQALKVASSALKQGNNFFKV